MRGGTAGMWYRSREWAPYPVLAPQFGLSMEVRRTLVVCPVGEQSSMGPFPTTCIVSFLNKN